MQKVTPFLWFNGNGEEAINFYTSIFKDSKIVQANRQGENGPLFSGAIKINGQDFMILNWNSEFKFTEAISFFIEMDTQEEVDYYWEKLSEGGQKSRCGWLKDKFGVSWQVVPRILGQLMNSGDSEKSQKVMQAMMKMDKLIVADLKAAAE